MKIFSIIIDSFTVGVTTLLFLLKVPIEGVILTIILSCLVLQFFFYILNQLLERKDHMERALEEISEYRIAWASGGISRALFNFITDPIYGEIESKFTKMMISIFLYVLYLGIMFGGAFAVTVYVFHYSWWFGVYAFFFIQALINVFVTAIFYKR